MSLADGVGPGAVAPPMRLPSEADRGLDRQRGGEGGEAPIDAARCAAAWSGLVGARELFVPLEKAEWVGRRLRLPFADRREARRRASGLRFEAAVEHDRGPEQRVQRDATGLIAALLRLRAAPGGKDLILAPRALSSGRLAGEPGRRARFSLALAKPGLSEARAAGLCYRRFVRAVHAAGYVVLEPKAFDAKGGFAGLMEFTRALRLGRRRRLWPWLLLLLPLLLLVRCDSVAPIEAFGIGLHEEDLFLLVDVSSSMQESFTALQEEARQVIREVLKDPRGRAIQVITYDANARAALTDLQPLNDARAAELYGFIAGFKEGGGTRLKAAIDLAAPVIHSRGRPTLLLVLTDARDHSVDELLREGPQLRARFGSAPLSMVVLPPRAFTDETPVIPNHESEHRIDALAKSLGGGFGQRELGL